MEIKDSVLLMPKATGGHLVGLQKILKMSNVDSIVVLFSADNFNFGCDYNFSGLSKLRRLFKFLSVFFKYRIVHYSDGRAVLPLMADVFIGRLLGKKIFVTFNGTRSRLKIISKYAHVFSQWGRRDDIVYTFKDFIRDVGVFLSKLSWALLADKVLYLNPDLGRFVPNSLFLPYYKLNVDTKLKDNHNNSNILNIAHAPSSRSIKGTQMLVDAVEVINRREKRINLILIEGLSNFEAIKAIGQADVLFDQIWVGWYGGVAVEALSQGVPVISYIRESDLKYIPKAMSEALPIIQVTPDTIYEVLLHLVAGDINLSELSAKSIDFFNQYHSIEAVSEKLLSVYRKKGVLFNE